MKRVLAVAGATVCLSLTAVLAVPFLVLGTGDLDAPDCPPGTSQSDPTILGAAALTSRQIERWWSTSAPTLDLRFDGNASIGDLIALYLDEASAEGVRGDIAFAQAVLETGYFTSSGTADNNFAGVAHYDGQASGDRFPDPATGVRAHVQLLKKYAAGNDADLAHPDVAPDAGAHATTWSRLAGRWATAPYYWDKISRIYDAMLDVAQVPGSPPVAAPGGERAPGSEQHTSTGIGHTPVPALPPILQPSTPATSPHAGPTPSDGGGGIASGTGTPLLCPTAAAAVGVAPHAGSDNAGAISLITVEGITVHESLAEPLAALLAAARQDGLHLTGWGYRSHQRQIELRREHCGTSHYAIYEMPSSSCSPPTARPGSSNHEQGLAIDFENCSTRSTGCFQWLANHAPGYGLFNLPSEPWHWSYNGS